MQNTLEEVELNAASGAKLFGPNHTAALEELRVAQIALAQAWTRTEAEEAEHSADAGEKRGSTSFTTADALLQERLGKTAQTRSRAASDASQRSGKSQTEEDTKTDVELAKRRREANDRYFQMVESGVKDVVQKLEVVAEKMREVERETQELWGEESIDGSMAGSVI